MEKIAVVIPAYNEADIIGDTIKALQTMKEISEIIVVDDGSTDSTWKVAEDSGAYVIRCEKNLGKGCALEKGKQVCNGTIIVFLDADVGKSAIEIHKIIKPIQEGICDVTIARFGRAKQKGGFGIVKTISRYGVKWITGQYIESVLSGQRAFKAEVLKNISIGKGYGAEVAMTIDIIKKGYRILQCDVNMTHKETGRNFQGFLHRGRQMYHIIKVLLNHIL